MTGSFRIKRSFQIPQTAIEYLENTIKCSPECVETIESITEAIDTGAGMLHLVENDGDIYGAIFSTIVPNPNGKDIFNVVVHGGKEQKAWKKELLQFIRDMTRATNTNLVIISRKAWKKLYPELKIKGYVYTL